MQVATALEWPRYRGAELERHINSIKDHPALLAWFLQDDFGGDLKMLENLEIIRKCETHIPTVVDTVGDDAGRRRASAFVDIHAPYGYPVARRQTYRWYADYLDHNRKIMDRQFNWTCPETFGMTAAKIRLETYIGLAHGIRGFMYWPGNALLDHRLSELGIVCLEVEPLTELIVEADIVANGASCDNKQIEVQRIDCGNHILLFLVNYRDRSVRWPDGELTPPATITVSNVGRDMKVYSMTLDKDLRVGRARRVGDDLQVKIKGLDIGAMILLTSDAEYARKQRKEFNARRAEATAFATTTNKYMSWVVYDKLYKLVQMQAPLGRSVEAYHNALQQIKMADNFTGQRRAARLLRQSMAEALAQADRFVAYAPAYVVSDLRQYYNYLPLFMASFNFRALTSTSSTKISAPPYIAPMAPLLVPPEPRRLKVGQTLGSGKGRTTEGFVVSLPARTACAVFQTKGRRLSLYAEKLSYDRSQTQERAPLVFEEYTELPRETPQWPRIFLCRPRQAMDLYIIAQKVRASLGVTSARPLQLGETVKEQNLSQQQPLALYEVDACKGDSFEATVTASPGCAVVARLCQVHPCYAQVLAEKRISAGQSQRLRCTLPDNGSLAIAVTTYAASAQFNLSARRITEKVMPQLRKGQFAGIKFGIFGKEPAGFTPHLAANGISGERLDGNLAAADLSRYDIIILLTNALRYDKVRELKANAEKLRRFVHEGGGLVLFQQNGWENWDESILPYSLELFKSGRRYEPPVVMESRLLGGFSPANFAYERKTVGFYPVKVKGDTDKRWKVLVYSDESKGEALAATCDYGKGKVIINQFAVLDRINEPAMRSLMVETVRYVLPKK